MAFRDVLRGAGRGARRTLVWILAILAAIVVAAVIASFFVDAPLRANLERRMNASLKGYKVTVPRAHFSLLGFSVRIYGLTIRQEEHPEPPVAQFGELKASVHWKELLSLHVVADFLIDHPQLHINLAQLETEAKRPTKMKDEGWQQAIESIYPLKMNLFRVHDGDVVYIDQDEKRPLHVSHLEMNATNIRNIHSRDRTYPSPVRVSAVVFEKGRFAADGHADFLAAPFAGFHITYEAKEIPVDALDVAAKRANLRVKGGTLASKGEIEWGPKIERVRVASLTVDGLKADFLHTAPTAAREKEHEEAVKEKAKEASNKPGLVLDISRMDLKRSELGYVNQEKSPGYRVFLDVDDLVVTNLSNHQEHGVAHASLKGKFMGSGTATATLAFQPVAKEADFALKLAIENTDLVRMNDILRAYGKFDVSAGFFSFFMELAVHQGKVDGYVKPLFRDMKVSDDRTEAEKSAFRKLYEKAVGAIAKLLENKPRKEVATEARIHGEVGSAKANTLQIIGKLVENAFFHAILPGFDDELRKLSGKR